ncbi:hypothetical protein CLV92_11652 [Kineococcus xinjiangensis]|uniref:Uncharacterized protein n=1 Tax=Kineococcus xinjiangensis TaxID=512762 RepID=A0A2S6IDE7_9ACTN|nr:hypothetical protein [Kineococcus xinjiangensis]PPK92190.1 hypothetical protein CLV92_11652 [Kineococcus xinjiangensis]
MSSTARQVPASGPHATRTAPAGAAAALLRAARRLPAPAVGIALALGAVLADAHAVLVQHLHATGSAEPAQWLGRLTLQQYWILIPVGALALLARVGAGRWRAGRVAALLLAVGPVVHVALTCAALVWGALLGRGDLPAQVMVVEALSLLTYPGLLLCGALLLRAGGPAVAWGALLLAGFLADLFLLHVMAVAYVLLSAVVVATASRVRAG